MLRARLSRTGDIKESAVVDTATILDFELSGSRLKRMDRLMHLANIPHQNQRDLKIEKLILSGEVREEMGVFLALLQCDRKPGPGLDGTIATEIINVFVTCSVARATPLFGQH